MYELIANIFINTIVAVCRESTASKFNDILLPLKDQELINMRYHVHYQDLNGLIGYYPQACQDINIKSQGHRHGCNKGLDTDQMVYKNTRVTLGGTISINDYNKNQLDTLTYTYPYNM